MKLALLNRELLQCATPHKGLVQIGFQIYVLLRKMENSLAKYCKEKDCGPGGGGL